MLSYTKSVNLRFGVGDYLAWIFCLLNYSYQLHFLGINKTYFNFIKGLQLFICLSLCLTLSWRRPLSYRNQSIDLRSKSINWFLYDNGLRHERVKLTSPQQFQISNSILLLKKCSRNYLLSWIAWLNCYQNWFWNWFDHYKVFHEKLCHYYFIHLTKYNLRIKV